MSKSILRTVSSASFLVLVVLAWWLLAPRQLGGRTSYAVIYGISMEPHFHSGDLVLMRQQPDYQVGEIVGYHSAKLGKPVMHRIVRIQNGRYWFKGDNNNFVDPEHPVASQLFGREWVRLPGFGARLEALHKPRNAALLGGLAALFVLGGGGIRAQRRKRRSAAAGAGPRLVPVHVPPAGEAPVEQEVVYTASQAEHLPAVTKQPAAGEKSSTTSPPPQSIPDPKWVVPALAIITAIGLAGIAAMSVVGIVAFTRPPETVVTQANLYTQRGTFGYSAFAPVGTVYDHSQVRPGDALFPGLVHSVDLKFRYGLSAYAPANVSGKARLDATLTDGHGWNRRLTVAPAQSFSGPRVSLAGSLDLERLTELVRRFEAVTGEHSTEYQLLLTPHVSVSGIVGEQLVHEVFTPSLLFELTQTRLRLATGADGANTNSLIRTRSGTGTTTQHHKLGSLGIATARRAALIGLPASILLALLGGYLFLVARNNDEVSLIQRRYGGWLIDVAPSDRPQHVERNVENIDALARIAERYERLILHEQRERTHTYLVEDGGLVYRYDAQEKGAWRFDRGHASPEAEKSAQAAPAAGASSEPTEQ